MAEAAAVREAVLVRVVVAVLGPAAIVFAPNAALQYRMKEGCPVMKQSAQSAARL